MKKQLPSSGTGLSCRLAYQNFFLLSLLITHVTVNGQVSLVKDINPTAGGAYAYEFMEMTTHKGDLYFLHNSAPDKYTLYKSDGTTAGSVSIREFAYAGEVESSGDYLYFVADEISPTGDPTPYGRELWRTDGTTAGTQLVKDIYQGTSNTESDVGFSNYPNPFSSHFSLNVKGEDESMYRIRVVDFNGQTIESATLSYNTDHTMGKTWNDGLYVLYVHTGDKIITRRIAKKN